MFLLKIKSFLLCNYSIHYYFGIPYQKVKQDPINYSNFCPYVCLYLMNRVRRKFHRWCTIAPTITTNIRKQNFFLIKNLFELNKLIKFEGSPINQMLFFNVFIHRMEPFVCVSGSILGRLF